MFCQHCGSQIADGSVFCSACGMKQGVTMPPPPVVTSPPVQLVSNDQSNSNKSNKEGEIRKCPSCGDVASSFSTTCKSCGHEFRGIEANSSIERLFDLLLKANNIEEKKSIILNFPVPNSKEAILEFLVQGSAIVSANTDSTAGNIANKGGRVLLGLYTFGISEALRKKDDESKLLTSVWKIKCEQIIAKARFSMKDDKEILVEIENCAKKLGIK